MYLFHEYTNLSSLVHGIVANTLGMPAIEKVYVEIKERAKDAVLAMIERERDGDQIDRALLKNVLNIFIAVGMGQMDAYETDFESKMLEDTSKYYKRKVRTARA